MVSAPPKVAAFALIIRQWLGRPGLSQQTRGRRRSFQRSLRRRRGSCFARRLNRSAASARDVSTLAMDDGAQDPSFPRAIDAKIEGVPVGVEANCLDLMNEGTGEGLGRVSAFPWRRGCHDLTLDVGGPGAHAQGSRDTAVGASEVSRIPGSFGSPHKPFLAAARHPRIGPRAANS